MVRRSAIPVGASPQASGRALRKKAPEAISRKKKLIEEAIQYSLSRSDRKSAGMIPQLKHSKSPTVRNVVAELLNQKPKKSK